MGEGAACRGPLDSERLMLEIEQEAQMKEVLELSLFEMRNTLTELEKRLNNIEDEDNEWKTRYETQIGLNRQLERQMGLLQGKMQQVCGNPTDRLASVRPLNKMNLESLNQFLKQLEEEKKSLQNQLKDYTLRLEQEAKAYHKANDERRAYLAVISQLSRSLKSSERQKVNEAEVKRENRILSTDPKTALTPKQTFPCSHCGRICLSRIGLVSHQRRCNIPKNQLTLDPKKGPIKKTTGVKLPKLKH